MPKMQYKLSDGTSVPLFEADYDTAFKVYKTDRRRAVIGDPKRCVEAISLCRLPNVNEAYIGSGKQAYVVYGPTENRPYVHAVHFTIPTSSAQVRDAFDTKRDLKSQTLILKAPPKGQKLEYRQAQNKVHRNAVKQGKPVAKRQRKAATRAQRLGVEHRPRAQIKSGTVHLGSDIKQT